jgi:hypothetical protein
MTATLADLLKDSAYRLDQFKPEHIAALEAGITFKEAGKTAAPYVTCLVRGKPIKLTPEEAVRQLYLRVLHLDMSYPIARMAVEYEVTFGREKKRADVSRAFGCGALSTSFRSTGGGDEGQRQNQALGGSSAVQCTRQTAGVR